MEEPMSEAIIPSGGPVYAVLEVNAGTAASIGLKVGDMIHNEIFGDCLHWTVFWIDAPRWLQANETTATRRDANDRCDRPADRRMNGPSQPTATDL